MSFLRAQRDAYAVGGGESKRPRRLSLWDSKGGTENVVYLKNVQPLAVSATSTKNTLTCTHVYAKINKRKEWDSMR